MRILYVHASFVPPPVNPQIDRFVLLSENLDGDVLQPVWFVTPEQVEEVFGPGSYPVYTRGRFRYHWFLVGSYSGAKQRLHMLWFYLRKGLEVYKERKFDCIVAYSHMSTGLIAGLLKVLTRTKLVIEIVTSPHLIYLTDRAKPTLHDRIMHRYSDLCLHLSMWLANRAHFLFPNQLGSYSLLRKVRNSTFHEFVPISIIDKRRGENESAPYVLLVGAPWYLKGVDLLIAAFKTIAPDFPQVKLKILGHYIEGNHELMALVGTSPQIEILKAKPHLETLQIISGALVMVHPSRCEGLPRVLIEGMAAGLPLVGSNVAGIPTLVHDGENGFIIPGENVALLAQRIRQLLAHRELRLQMGEASHRRARAEFTESIYVAEFTRMIEDTTQDAA